MLNTNQRQALAMIAASSASVDEALASTQQRQIFVVTFVVAAATATLLLVSSLAKPQPKHRDWWDQVAEAGRSAMVATT